MKYLIVSDFHIDEAKRLGDTESILNFIADKVTEQTPDFLYILGDVFNKRKPTPREMRLFNQWLLKIRDFVTNAIIVLEGNHDQDRGVSALSYLADLGISKVEVVNPPYKINGFYLGHEMIAGCTLDNGCIAWNGLSVTDLISTHQDTHTFAFGHIHKSQVLRTDPYVFYAGSINTTTFGEAGEEKFIWIFNDAVLVEKISIPTRPMYSYLIDYNDQNIEAPWANPILDLNGALVKIVFRGTKELLSGIKVTAIKGYLRDHGVLSSIILFDQTDKVKPRNQAINESAKDEDILKEYFKGDTLRVQTGLQIIKKVTDNG